MDGCRPREIEQMADAPVETVHLTDDDAEVFAGRGETGLAERELGRGPETGHRIPYSIGGGGGPVRRPDWTSCACVRSSWATLASSSALSRSTPARDCRKWSVMVANDRARSPISPEARASIG